MLEELGTYDPLVPETDARAVLNGERITYWIGVGAQPSDKVRVLIKKYGAGGTHVEAQRLALAQLAQSRRRPEPPPPMPKAEKPPKPAEGERPPKRRRQAGRGRPGSGRARGRPRGGRAEAGQEAAAPRNKTDRRQCALTS